jgi:hypothetical protein
MAKLVEERDPNKIEFEGFMADARSEISSERQSFTLTIQEGNKDRIPGRIMLFSMSTGPGQKNVVGEIAWPFPSQALFKVTIERL